MFKKLLSFWEKSKPVEEENFEKLQLEIINLLGIILFAFNGEINIQKEVVEGYFNGKFLPKIEYMENGEIKLWLEEIDENFMKDSYE